MKQIHEDPPSTDSNSLSVLVTSPSPLSKRKLIILGVALILIIVLVFISTVPVNLYLTSNSLLYPHALKVNDQTISWGQLKDEVTLVSNDKSLKVRQQLLERAIDKSIERQILRQATATTSAAVYLTLFEEYQARKKQVEENLTNSRTGGYFIARFKVPQAIESVNVLKQQAKSEIEKIKKKLDEGQTTQEVLAEAMQNTTIRNLNGGAFLPGVYLEKVTEDEFPLKIKSFRDRFFLMTAPQVSDIITLSWDDYDGPSYDQKFKGEFAYAVARIDQINPGFFGDYNAWLNTQKQNAKVQSNVLIPFFFAWF